eukprot:365685-Chlamydomonas_euryale.AAC.6
MAAARAVWSVDGTSAWCVGCECQQSEWYGFALSGGKGEWAVSVGGDEVGCGGWEDKVAEAECKLRKAHV